MSGTKRKVFGAEFKAKVGWEAIHGVSLHLKRWRGIVTRYAKCSASFLAVVHIRCIALWANIP